MSRRAAAIGCGLFGMAITALLCACESPEGGDSLPGTQQGRDFESAQIQDEMDSQESTDLDSGG